MSKDLLIKNVIKKCVNGLVGYDTIEEAEMTAIHEFIKKEFRLELHKIINTFISELSKHYVIEEKKELVLKYQNQFASDELKKIFQYDVHYSDHFKKECIDNSQILDRRRTKRLFDNERVNEHSLDFYCVFLGEPGWNFWLEKYNKTPFTISVEHNNKDNTITQRYEVVDLPKELNTTPILEIENYISRIEIVEEIFAAFQKKNKKVNVTGISGIGKTFLAKHFVHHYFDHFTHIVWLNGVGGFVKAFSRGRGVELLDNMGLVSEYQSFAEGKMSDEGLMRLALARMKKMEGKNLLILDNVKEDVAFFEDELHLSANWKILTTSQSKLDGFYNFVAPYFDKESIHLFYKYYTLEQDDDNLNRLLLSIEYHTLAIELLARTAEQKGLTVLQLISRFTENGINVAERTKIDTKHSKERGLSVENIEEYLKIIFDTSNLSEEECKVLLNIAILQNNAIEYTLFEEVFLSGNENRKDRDVLQGIIDALNMKGWITKDNGFIQLHELTKNIIFQQFVSNRLFWDSALMYLKGKTRISMSEDYFQRAKYFLLCENIYLNSEKKHPLIAQLVANELASYYSNIGLPYKSMEVFSKYFLPNKDEETSIALMGKYKEYANHLYGIKDYDNALDYNTKIYNFFIESKNMLINIKSASHYLLEFCQEGFSKDEFQKKELLSIFANMLLENLVLFSHTTNDIGVLLRYKGEIENSVKMLTFTLHYRQVLIDGLENYLKKEEDYLNFSKKFLDDCKNFYSITLNNLGLTYFHQKGYSQARESFESALKIREAILGENNHSLSNIYHNLSDLFLATGDLRNALKYITKDVILCENLPENDPIKKNAHKKLLRYQQTAYKNNDPLMLNSIKLIERAVHSEIEKFFSTHTILNNESNENYMDLSLYYNIIANHYYKFHFLEKAIGYYNKEVGLKELFYADNYTGIGVIYQRIAFCYLQMGMGKEAYSSIKKAIESYTTGKLPVSGHHMVEAEGILKESVEKSYRQGDKKIIEKEIDNLLKNISIELKSLDRTKSSNKQIRQIPVNDIINWKRETDEIFSEEHFKAQLTEYHKKLMSLIGDNYFLYSVSDFNVFIGNLVEFYQKIGSLFMKYNLWEKTVGCFLRVLTISEILVGKKENLLISTLNYNVSLCYLNIGDSDLADHYNRKASEILTTLPESVQQHDIETYKNVLKRVIENQKLIDAEINKHK